MSIVKNIHIVGGLEDGGIGIIKNASASCLIWTSLGVMLSLKSITAATLS